MAVEMTYSSVYQFSFKMYFILSFLGCCGKSAAGMVILSPMMVASVCRIGDPLQLTCTGSVEFIRWSIVVVNEHGMEEDIDAIRNSLDSSPPPIDRIINSTTFTFTRTSAEDVLPLISTLSIDSVSIDLNGTVVNCMDANNPTTSNSTTIQITNLYTPKVGIISEDFGADNVTVAVEWAQHVGITTYIARISPLAQPTLSTSTPGLSNNRLLILSYNTIYNLTVVAVTPCGNTTAFVELKYAKCGHPNLLQQVNNDSVPIIDAYDSIPFLEGSIIRFSCPSGLELTGPNSANCTGNGEWEPDPSGLMCNVSEVMCENLFNKSVGSSLYILDYSEPAVVGTTVSFDCSQPGEILIGPNTVTCMDGGQWIPDPSQLQMSCKASCGTPEIHSSVNYSSYNSTLEGATVTFRCTNVPFQDKEFTSMCLKNATWIPDPVRLCSMLRPAHCDPPPSSPTNGHVIPYTNTLEGAMVTYICWSVHHEENISLCTEINTTAICNKNGNWEPDSQDKCSVFSGKKSSEVLNQEGKIAVASSITVFAVTSILFFVAGFLSRHFICRNERMVVDHVKKQTPVYDDVVLKGESERELELKENIAYGPVRTIMN